MLAWASKEKLTNWAGNLEYGTERLTAASSQADVQQFVTTHSNFKVLGTRHCFNNIADSKDELLSLRQMDQVVAMDAKAKTVTVESGISYGKLAPYLDSKGFALHNLASLPHISIAGACSTATHGSGEKNGNLSSAVAALEFVNAVEVRKNEIKAFGEVTDEIRYGVIIERLVCRNQESARKRLTKD